MKSFNRIFIVIIAAAALIFILANAAASGFGESPAGRPYRVEVGRISLTIERDGFESVDLSKYKYVSGVYQYSDSADFYNSDSDYIIREINGQLYRFDYSHTDNTNKVRITLLINIIIGIMTLLIIGVMLFIRQKILRPFEQLTDVPYQLSKGNLTVPIKENKSRFFGKFIWSINLLRENMEAQKLREMELLKEKKTLLLSLSHDIKTPLSAIKLYSKALSKGLYSPDKTGEIAENINAKADEIEGYVSQIITASKEDFLSLNVNPGDFYLSELIKNLSDYYSEKLALIKTDFDITDYSDCLLKGDINRSIEVFQNIIENAVKYGDGRYIGISFSREENCVLISVKNSGCTLPESELIHIFESFWRGQNSKSSQGCGLGLYICRQLMNKMGGEIFAEIHDSFMIVTAVFEKA